MKDLEIGKDYISITPWASTGNKMIYIGNDSFRLVKATGEATEITNKKQADTFRAYINQPAIHMGRL